MLCQLPIFGVELFILFRPLPVRIPSLVSESLSLVTFFSAMDRVKSPESALYAAMTYDMRIITGSTMFFRRMSAIRVLKKDVISV